MVPLFRALGLYFLFTALGKAHEYRLRRTLDFRKLFWPQLLAGLTKGAVSIVLALEGAGAWSLIVGQLAGALCQSAVLWRVHPWRPSFVISRSHLRPMLRFGLGIVAVGLLGQGAANFDFLVVGAKLGAVALGVYYLAFRLPELVILSGFQVANDVLFPFYARIKEGEISGADELRRGYLETVRLGSMVAFPAAFAMAALALPLVLTLYGEQWRAAAEPLALVAIWAGLASLASLPGAVFKALGRSWLLTATGVMQIAILFPAVWFAADYSITAVAAAQVVEKTISLALLGVVIGRILDIPWYATFKAGAPALALSALMAAALFPLGQVMPPELALAVGIPFGLLMYLVAAARPGARGLSQPHPTAGRCPLDAAASSHARAAAGAARRAGARRLRRNPDASGGRLLGGAAGVLRGAERPQLQPRNPPTAPADAGARAEAATGGRSSLRAGRQLHRAHLRARGARPSRRAHRRKQLPRGASGGQGQALALQPELLDDPRHRRDALGPHSDQPRARLRWHEMGMGAVGDLEPPGPGRVPGRRRRRRQPAAGPIHAAQELHPRHRAERRTRPGPQHLRQRLQRQPGCRRADRAQHRAQRDQWPRHQVRPG